jgi:hypothetical protein
VQRRKRGAKDSRIWAAKRRTAETGRCLRFSGARDFNFWLNRRNYGYATPIWLTRTRWRPKWPATGEIVGRLDRDLDGRRSLQ